MEKSAVCACDIQMHGHCATCPASSYVTESTKYHLNANQQLNLEY
jgi:hypothetical protein